MQTSNCHDPAQQYHMRMQLLECTLRDGSYAIDFQFTDKFTGQFCSSLEILGFSLIEIGHGMGIGASKKFRPAASTDIEYARAASLALKKSHWGMFAQPGLSELSDIRNLSDLGMKFIRIGVDIDEIRLGLDLALSCYELGLDVYINLMKSYRSSPIELSMKLEIVKECNWLSGFYLVDSAGGMLSSEISQFAEVLKRTFGENLALGFHGHDNLGLALPHSVDLINRGFDLIDCTMQGLGRSSGNTNAERLVAILSRSGIDVGIDPIEIMRTSEELIRPLLPMAGHSGLDTMAGFTLFHTAYMEQLIEIARYERVDPYYLMKEIGTASPKECDLGSIIQKLKMDNKYLKTSLPRDKYIGNEQK
jgi:4-hydroxy 2-oxovalerate aldolase